MSADRKTKKTILTLNKNKKEGKSSVLVTAYDYPQSRIADNAGVDCILVGDSLGMTTLGHKTTIPVTMDDMMRSCESVSRGADDALLIGDMPYMSYQPSDQTAVENAGRFIRAGMDMVKVEGAMTDRIKAICDSGILVMSHLGLTPHTRAKLGGYKVQGKTAEQAEIVLKQALKLEKAGCSALLLEAMPKEPAGIISKELNIPVFGIGAGDEVDGQLVIFHDLMGLFWEFKSKFVKRYCEAGQIMTDALKNYASEVRDRKFPSQENFYEIKEEELEKLLGDKKWKYELDKDYYNNPNHSVTPITSTKTPNKR
ncbi:3-methyl-2-oxobutanoate hydroxymethyltransferase [Flavobacteriaceae bacterium]|nr:3-methyl-2-oxobutanoate hydroxymethyltransferase [Flavobacteriaceae bacterium]